MVVSVKLRFPQSGFSATHRTADQTIRSSHFVVLPEDYAYARSHAEQQTQGYSIRGQALLLICLGRLIDRAAVLSGFLHEFCRTSSLRVVLSILAFSV